MIFNYANPKSSPVKLAAKYINGYLIDGPDILLGSRTSHLQDFVQPMLVGSIPADGGFLSNIDEAEYESILEHDPIAAKYLRQIIGADELLYNRKRYCLWLVDVSPSDIRNSIVLKERIESVKAMRLSSTKKATQISAQSSTLFQEIRQPNSKYLAVPRISSELRQYVPMALIQPEVVANNRLAMIPNADSVTFAILQSSSFNLWLATVSGRLESRYSISNEITYNNFPFPDLTAETRDELAKTGELILTCRQEYPEDNLATLYDQTAMPTNLRKAHLANDKAVLKSYGLSTSISDQELLTYLFDLCKKLGDEGKSKSV
jgi:hypothetical protein